MGDLFHYDIEFITIAKILWYARAAECKKHTFMFLTKRPERMRDFFFAYAKAEGFKLPIKNFWLGVTAENQQRLCERVAELLKIPAAVRFVSVEPMLGPVNLTQIDVEQHQEDWCVINALNGKHTDMGRPCHDVPRLDWVIAGGETGPGARPMNQDWVRSLRDQCVSNGVKFFFKGWGAWTGSADFESGKMVSGSKRKPRLLDGREWNDLPNNKP
jgi:protein gp37